LRKEERVTVVPRFLASVALGLASLGTALGPALAGDQFILLGYEATQKAAQGTAATSGAWVLDTDLYPKLPANRFAIVHGPFATATEAKAELSFLRSGGEHTEAMVKDAGDCRLPLGIGDGKVPAAVFTALLGELTVEVDDRVGATTPCEPQEPYQRVEVRITSLGPSKEGGSAPLQALPQALPLGGFFVIKRTGEVQRLRICVE
jgi:hypothetical protein